MAVWSDREPDDTAAVCTICGHRFSQGPAGSLTAPGVVCPAKSEHALVLPAPPHQMIMGLYRHGLLGTYARSREDAEQLARRAEHDPRSIDWWAWTDTGINWDEESR